MIKVKRYAPKELGVEKSLIDKLVEETDEAIAYYDAEFKKKEDDENHKIVAFEFKSYGKTKPHLIKVYNGKCAYCEVNVMVAQPGDVEHFRPKAGIDPRWTGIDNLSNTLEEPPKDLKEIKPGYYWLGANWDNLLLSCNSCNRKSTHLNASKNTSEFLDKDALKKETLGKGTRFPYTDYRMRVVKPGDDMSKEKEVRLLIDPGEDNPIEHLEFVKHKGRKNSLFETSRVETEEKFGMIKALDDKGLASIQIFGLARYQLVLDREKEAHELMRVLADLKKAVIDFVATREELQKNPANDFAKQMEISISETISTKMDALTAQFKNSSPETSPSQFLGMKRKMLRNWIKDSNAILVDLKEMDIDIERLLTLDLLKELNFLRQLTKAYDSVKEDANEEVKALKDLILKVWKAIDQETSAGSEFLVSKKTLVEGWVEAMKVHDTLVIDTLKSLQLDTDTLV